MLVLLPHRGGRLMSACYQDGCLAIGTKERPLIVVADKVGASYGGSVVHGCKDHADSYRPERPLQSRAGRR